MLTLLGLLFWLWLIGSVLALYMFLAGRMLRVDRQPDELHFVTTSDSWRLGLARYRPATTSHAPPLLLCPGLAMTGQLFDVSPERSLARFLSGHGHDVWVLDWRGRGESERPRLWGPRRFSWTFDDYVAFDLPAVLELLEVRTGQPAVGVGCGLGGLALLVAAAGPAKGRLRAVAALGTSAFFRRSGRELPRWSLALLRHVRIELLTRLFAPLLGRFFPGPLAALQNRDAIDPPLYRRALLNAACSPSGRELRQLDDWLRGDLFTGVDQELDYRKLLGEVTQPVLLLAGVRDLLASPDSVEQTAAALGSTDRQVIAASRMHGMASNYGHLDLVIGVNAARDIFPHLLRWLDRQASLAIAPDRPQPPIGEATGLATDTATTAALGPRAAPRAPITPPPPPSSGDDPRQRDSGAEEEDDLDWLSGDVPRVPRPDDRS